MRGRVVRACGLAVSLVLAVLAGRDANAQDAPVERKLALLVGVKAYDHADLKNLYFPENDVEELGAVLKNDGFHVVVLSTSRGMRGAAYRPTAYNIRSQLKALLRGVTKRDLIIIGLAGHGIQPLGSDDSFFCPADANPVIRNDKPVDPARLISIGELLAMLSDSGIGHKLLLVDACRNDPSARSARHRGVDHVNVSALPSQTGVLLSCSQGEFSFEEKSLGSTGGLKGHGVFFYHVIEGLKGAAKDGRSQVTWDGLGSYVRTEVPQTVGRLFGKDGGEQSPNAIGNLRGAPVTLARITAAPRNRKPSTRANLPTRIQVWWGGGVSKVFEEMVQRFNKSHPRTFVDLKIYSDRGIVQRELSKALQSGKVPDVAVIEISSGIALIAAHGGLFAFDDLAKSDPTFHPEDLAPETVAGLRHNGKLYALPMNPCVPLLFYNKERFIAAGLDPGKPPETWEQVREFSKKLTSKDGRQYGLVVDSDSNVFGALVWSNGGEMSNGTKTTFAEHGTQGLQLWADMVHRDKTARYGKGSEFFEGRAAMFVQSTSALSGFVRESPFKVGTAMMPRFGNYKIAVPLFGGAAVIPAKAQQKKAAWEFLTWFTNTQQQADWSRATGYVPVRISARALLQTEGFYVQHPEFNTAIEELKFARDSVALQKPWTIIGGAMTSILRYDAPALQTLKAAEEECNRILDPRSSAKP
jgi:sn-glycerol 3-phosphate transport system substrate-binding protein